MFKTLFQYTLSVAMCSLPVITVLLAASAEMVNYTVSRIEMDTLSTLWANIVHTLLGVSKRRILPLLIPYLANE